MVERKTSGGRKSPAPAAPGTADKASPASSARRVLIITGMSGAGKTSALKALEDIGFEAVDNMPIDLLNRLLALPGDAVDQQPDRPLAVGIDARTRAFDATQIVDQLKALQDQSEYDVSVLFLDCSGEELARRFSETRRRHPLALDRPVKDGIAREREILAPLRRWAHVIVDTTDDSVHQLRRTMSELFGLSQPLEMTLTLMSFGYARGVPRDADMMFDMRFLKNPHWVEGLRVRTGLDADVGDYIQTDEAFSDAFDNIANLVLKLLPRYQREGKSYLTIAFGCTGGKHRSVFVTEQMSNVLKNSGYSLSIVHRDLKIQTIGENDVRRDVAKETVEK